MCRIFFKKSRQTVYAGESCIWGKQMIAAKIWIVPVPEERPHTVL